MFLSGLKTEGAVKLGFEARIELYVPPAANPVMKDLLVPASRVAKLPGWEGSTSPLTTVNSGFSGGLVSRSSAKVAGKISVNIANPPRTTVLEWSFGDQVNPRRGSTVYPCRPLKA